MALERAAALLETALSKRPRTRERVDALVRQIEHARHDRRRLPEAGRALEAMRRGKSYKALGFATYAAFLKSIGISRSTAHVWRVAAREESAAPEESARGDEPGVERAEAAARRIAEDLAAKGISGARVFLVGEADAMVVRVEVAVKDAGRIRVE